MKRVFRVLDDPYFGIIIGAATLAASITDLALRRRHARHEAWDTALKEELPDGAEAN